VVLALIGCCTLLPGAALARAQSGAVKIRPLAAGDCAVVLDVAQDVKWEEIGLFLDSSRHELIFRLDSVNTFVASLREPLESSSIVIATVLGVEKDRAQVQPQPSPNGDGSGDGDRDDRDCQSTGAPQVGVFDDRATFETNAYYGRVFDNFAPAEILGRDYIKPPEGAIDSRWTGGFHAQYRVFGGSDDARQVWLVAHTLHGSRSADLDCQKDPKLTGCSGQEGARVLSAIEHAGTMEAHLDVRYEFLRRNEDSDTPVKFYAATRFGFLAMSGTSKVFSSDTYLAGGLLLPKGAFRGSFGQIGIGRSRQFQSDPSAKRLKVHGTLIFDIAPSLVGQARNIITQTVSSTRAFVSIVVDRNPQGRAPDAVQTYIGIDFDIRRLISAF
jgi:hypothetical protein